MNVVRGAYVKHFGNPVVTFEAKAQEALHVVILTKRLRISSSSKEELDHYAKLFGDSTVMAKYGTGTVKDRKYTEKRLDVLTERWKNKIAFSGFSIWLKDEEKKSKQERGNEEFIGYAYLGQGDEANSAELGFMLHANHWNQGYASEASGALALFYARELASTGYKLPDGSCFKRIIATVRTDNPASARVLEKTGLTYYKQSNRFGTLRNYYELKVEDLLKEA